MNKIISEERWAVNPKDIRYYNTEQLRRQFFIEKVFEEEKILLTYSAYDRFIVGGAMPVKGVLSLDAIDYLKAKFFCDSREVGIINIGGTGLINVDGNEILLDTKEALYVGKGTLSITLKSNSANHPAMFYINSATAHHSYPTKKIELKDAKVLDIGKTEEANKRQIIQYIVAATVETCQLQMGMTKLNIGSVWNTIPPHTHNPRMEAYFYTS